MMEDRSREEYGSEANGPALASFDKNGNFSYVGDRLAHELARRGQCSQPSHPSWFF